MGELNLRKQCPYFNWQYLFRVIAWRFCEIFSRVCLLVLIWINLGGVSLSIILSIELMACFKFCTLNKTPDIMGNMMYLTMTLKKNGFFFFYRFFSHYIFLILITIFAAVDFHSYSVPQFTERNSITFGSKLGLIFFVWSWLGGIISNCAFIGVLGLGAIGGAETNRDIIEYLRARQFDEAQQLLMFGVNPKVDKNGNNILHGLCRFGRIKGMVWMKKYCKTNKEYINAKNSNGERTPIMVCAFNAYANYETEKETQEREEIILYLLEQGAETHHKDELGHDILYYCKKVGLKNAENVILKM